MEVGGKGGGVGSRMVEGGLVQGKVHHRIESNSHNSAIA